MNFFYWLFPKRCVGCGRLGMYICFGCVNKFKVCKKQVCPMCGKGSVYGQVHWKCRKKLGMEGLLCVFEYSAIVKKIISKIKYGYVSDQIAALIEVVISLGEWLPLENQSWLVVPVPLHKRRLRERGFNQSELIAIKLGRYWGWPVEAILVRKVYTKPQALLKERDRLVNVKGAFGLRNNFSKTKRSGLNVLLVDDVWTTGSTMKECAKVLKRAGVKQVWGVVVAS